MAREVYGGAREDHRDQSKTWEVTLRRVAMTVLTLLAWGRDIERGEGDKVDVDI